MFKSVSRLGVGVVALTLFAALSALPVTAANTYTLTPSTFVGKAGDCGATSPAGTPGGVVARFDNTVGNPAPSLFLAKNVATTDCSSAGATVNGVSGITLTELNFDVKGSCGAGAPRFNVVTSDNVLHFFGCADGTQTPTGNGFTHVVFSPTNPAQAFPVIASGTTVKSIELVFDEHGQAYVDNVSINNQIIGGPSTPKTANDCKDGGYRNLQDANGQTFRNQGQCVSYFNHLNNGKYDNGNDNSAGHGNGHGSNGEQGDD